ncbi:hypothetical protein [Blastopirellula marina]|uniref:Uncharacterized protein n=1 Tax=Blastopirellula marina TaxID=124 RepID=A0A2S8FLP7_9BACT|nr:hypothetical protein [Blastopirellula marina]PQO33105.1 hypothetical protein C5Y98_18405 [Blastopirellula marina]PTL43272.1 hypothetical protein C5Y97_18415 [Blastopirellula marina]
MLSRFPAIRLAAICLSLLALVGGCRTTDPSIQLLEHEARGLEDKVYHLHDIVQRKEAEIASLRRENETLRKQLGLPQGKTAASIEEEIIPAPASRSMEVNLEELENSMSPVIEMGASSSLPDLESVAPGPELMEGPLLEEFQPIQEVVTDRVVTKIVLNPKLTGGYNVDNTPGDDGLMVVIEPQNAEGQYVDAAGPVSVVLLDPAFADKEAFVDRWDFDAAYAAEHLQCTLLGKGVHLKIPWTEGPPEHESLQLHVRYTTEDGEVLQEKKEIKIDLRGGTSQSWTPATVPLPGPRTAAKPSEPSSEASPERPGLLKKPLWKPFR